MKKKWTLELAKKLKELVEHRDYVVMVGGDVVSQLELNPDPKKYKSFGDFATGLGEGNEDQTPENPLEDYNPEEFKVFKLMDGWIDA